MEGRKINKETRFYPPTLSLISPIVTDAINTHGFQAIDRVYTPWGLVQRINHLSRREGPEAEIKRKIRVENKSRQNLTNEEYLTGIGLQTLFEKKRSLLVRALYSMLHVLPGYRKPNLTTI